MVRKSNCNRMQLVILFPCPVLSEDRIHVIEYDISWWARARNMNTTVISTAVVNEKIL